MILKWFKERQMERRAVKGQHPVHGRTLGYLGTAREPYTWFVCNNGHTEMGSPWEKPERDCIMCGYGDTPFIAWEVADSSRATSATLDACGPSPGVIDRYARTQG